MSPGSIGLVVGLVVPFPQVGLSPGRGFLPGEVCLNLDSPGEDVMPGPESSSMLGTVRADRTKVVEPGDNGGTISDDVGGEKSRFGVSAEAKVSEF
jgi:hypothetical protein